MTLLTLPSEIHRMMRRLQDINQDNDVNIEDDDDLESSPNTAPDIPPANMAVAVVPILLVLLLSLYLKLGYVRTLLAASTRCVCQVLLLGLILVPIFHNNEPYVVLPYLLVMVTFATREASVKPKHYYDGMTRHIFVSMILAITISLLVINFGVLQPDPWQEAAVMIPVGGMMLGSCVNALSLGMDRFLLSLRGTDGSRGSAMLQTYLAVGATKWETALPSIRQALETGLTPNLNQMSVMGLVSIPGMLTGQLLSGTPPLVAAKYQIVIMFFICSNSTITLFLVMLQAVFQKLFLATEKGDSTCITFQSQWVHKRSGGKPKDILLAFLAFVGSVAEYIWQTLNGKKKTATETDESNDNNKNNVEDVETEAIVKDNSNNSSSSISNPPSTTGTFVRLVSANEEPSNHDVCDDEKTATADNHNPQKNRPLLLKLKDGAMSVSGTPLLSDLNINVRKGEILFLTGPSGCGKSTCLKALAKLEPLDEGRMSWHDADTKSTNNNHHSTSTTIISWRSEVLYVRQNGGQGLQGTPIELLADLCALEALFRRFEGNVETVLTGLEQNLQHLDLPSTMMENRWDSLSGGESQRVYLCLMLALQPSILLLDEPTSACDEQSARKVEAMIVSSGIAAVWVSHDPSQIERLQEFPQTSVLAFQRKNQTIMENTSSSKTSPCPSSSRELTC